MELKGVERKTVELIQEVISAEAYSLLAKNIFTQRINSHDTVNISSHDINGNITLWGLGGF